MNVRELTFREQVEQAIKKLSRTSTSRIIKSIKQIENNLIQLESREQKIVSLAEHKRIRLGLQLLKEVLRDRNGGITPLEPIVPTKHRARLSKRTNLLKIV